MVLWSGQDFLSFYKILVLATPSFSEVILIMAQDSRQILSIRIYDEPYELLTAMWNPYDWDLDIVGEGLVNTK